MGKLLKKARLVAAYVVVVAAAPAIMWALAAWEDSELERIRNLGND